MQKFAKECNYSILRELLSLKEWKTNLFHEFYHIETHQKMITRCLEPIFPFLAFDLAINFPSNKATPLPIG